MIFLCIYMMCVHATKYMRFLKHLSATMTNLFEKHVSYSLGDNYPFVGSCSSTNLRSFPPEFLLLFSLLLLEPIPQKKGTFFNITSHIGPILSTDHFWMVVTAHSFPS